MAEYIRVDDHGLTDGVNPFAFMNTADDRVIGLIPFDNNSDCPRSEHGGRFAVYRDGCHEEGTENTKITGIRELCNDWANDLNPIPRVYSCSLIANSSCSEDSVEVPNGVNMNISKGDDLMEGVDRQCSMLTILADFIG